MVTIMGLFRFVPGGCSKVYVVHARASPHHELETWRRGQRGRRHLGRANHKHMWCVLGQRFFQRCAR